MAVELILTIASRRFMIFGSGTCSTLTSCLPYQQFALITSPFLVLLPAADADAQRLRGALLRVALARHGRVRDDDLAGLDDLLEAAQVCLQLPVGLLAEELRDERADRTARRAVIYLDVDDRAAPARRALQADRAGVLNLRAFERAPRDQLVRDRK